MILFRRLTYRVRVKTRMEWSPRLQRNAWKRFAGNVEERRRKHLHVFLEDGTDFIGQRWKSICGRYYHGPKSRSLTIEREISGFLLDSDPCAICVGWLLKNKEEVLVAERLAER